MPITTVDNFQYALSSNKAWAGYKAHQNPEYFRNLSAGQSPTILWLGCADSRVPETTILGCQPGDIFVHRNIANVISPTDISVTAVIEYAVTKLQVKHVVLCGHTHCGGANAALGDERVGGVLDTWLTPLSALRFQHADELDALPSSDARAARLAELNVAVGVAALRANWAVREGIRGWGLQVHGCIFEVETGKVRELGPTAPASPPLSPAGSVSGEGDVVRGKHAMLVFNGDNNAAMMVR